MVVRSPSYPGIPLKQALLRARDLFELERHNPMSREAAARLLGYSGLTGGSNALLSDLSAYGLIERVGKGEIRVSQNLVKIIHPNDQAEYTEALTTAAMSPKLFTMLRERFPDHLPSDGNLEGYLVRMGFSSAGTKPAKKAFLETFQYLQEETGSESHSDERPPALDSPKSEAVAAIQIEEAAPPAPRRREVKSNMKEDVFTLPEGDVVFQWPARISAESFEEVKAWTELMLKKLKRQIAIEELAGPGSDD